MKSPVITVVNRHKQGQPLKPSVYVGRPHVLGNPFILGTHGDRAVVVPKYEEWLVKKLQEKDRVVCNAMNTLYLLAKRHGHLELVCSCKPQACHADIIKKVLDHIFTERAA